MLLALWGAELIHRNISYALNYKKIIKQIFLTGIILTWIMWPTGYFMVHNGLIMQGLGYYRMNLLSFIDPSDDSFDSWSYILKKQPHTPGDYEGFSFLGLGMIILGFLALSALLKRSIKNFSMHLKQFYPLIAIVFLLMIMALSNQIVIGQRELFQYWLPEIVGMFRATGRMVLPMYYLIYFGIFYVIIKCYPKYVALSSIFICLTIQVADSSRVYRHFRIWLGQSKVDIPSLKSPIWAIAAKKYQKIIYIPPQFYSSDWVPIVYYSAFNRLKINIGYFARVDFEKLNKDKNKLIHALLSGKLDKIALYIIKDPNIRKMIVILK